jgi:hypothetical protein
MVVPTPPQANGPMRRFLRWLSRLFARPKPARPQPAPGRRRPSFEGLEERRMLAAGIGAVVPLVAPPTRHTLVARLNPQDLHTIEVGSSQGGSFTNILLGPNQNGVPAGAFALSGPGGARGRHVLVVVNDFNGDGLPDLAIHFGSTIQVRLSQPDGSFATVFQTPRRASLKVSSLVVGDFNGDGRPDLLTVSQPTQGQGDVFSLLLGNGNGTFTPPPRRDDRHDLRDALTTASRSGALDGLVVWRGLAAPVVENPTRIASPAVDADPARPPRPVDPDPIGRASPAATAGDDPNGGDGILAHHSGGPSAGAPGNQGSDGPEPAPGLAHSSAPADGRHGDPAGEGGGPGGSLRLDGNRTDLLAGEPLAPLGAAFLGLARGTAGGDPLTAGAPVGWVESPAPALAAGAASADGELARLVTAARAPAAANLGEQGQEEETFWTFFGAGRLRQALAEAAGLAPGASLTLASPTQEPAGRWRAAGLGGLLAQAFSLGNLKQAGTGAGLEGGSLPLQSLSDSQFLLADLTQRLTDAFSRLMQSFYLHFLGRAAEAGEVNGWVGLLLAGQTEEQVLSAFLSTAEFYQRTAALIPAGTEDERFLQGLYRLLLGRPAADAEVGGWLAALSTLGRDGVAAALLHSTEYRTRQVETYFQEVLQRPGSPAEVASWANSPFDLKTIRILLETNLPAPAEQ